MMAFLEKSGQKPFPVEGCIGQAEMQTAMQAHFCHRNVRDTVEIMEEGKFPHPWCPMCNMLMPCRNLNGSHKSTLQCKKGVEQKQRCLASEEERAEISRAFSAYGCTLEMVLYFIHLEIVLLAADNDWPVEIQNLTKAQAVWRRMKRILSRKGARPRMSVFFFKDVVQLVLLFGVETWVVTPCMGRVLGVFQDRVVRRLTGRLLRRRLDTKW